MPALSAVPWTDCVTGYWHISVFMFVSCVYECMCVCAVRCAHRAMCGRGSSHVLRPSAPLSILVGALACGGPARVTGKQQSASCERACSGKKILQFLPRTMGSVLQTRFPFFFPLCKSHGRSSCTRAAYDIHNENVLLGTVDCLCEPFGLCEQFQ